MVTGRFAPSPSGPLHLGNLRTAIVAWLAARATGGRFLVRVEDLDAERSRAGFERSQLADLARVGIDWDEPPIRQSERLTRYAAVIEALIDAGATYECFCTRREIAEATLAPNEAGAERPYPGTCRGLDAARRAQRRSSRPPAIRLRADGELVEWHDLVMGPMSGTSDDVVIRRNDGAPAYNLAVVVDDRDSGVTQVVRGDDIAPSTPRQVAIARRLGAAMPGYAHVPLVRGPDGARLAKRHGAVTLDELVLEGRPTDHVVAAIVGSLALELPGGRVDRLGELADGFELASMASASPSIVLSTR
ncbi:MAG: tRNA glutamyl-Q(34) synthetase GluQRS [Candidatus Limnocylindrales bacterium]